MLDATTSGQCSTFVSANFRTVFSSMATSVAQCDCSGLDHLRKRLVESTEQGREDDDIDEPRSDQKGHDTSEKTKVPPPPDEIDQHSGGEQAEQIVQQPTPREYVGCLADSLKCSFPKSAGTCISKG